MGARAYYPVLLAIAVWLCTFVLVNKYQSGNLDSTALTAWVYILAMIVAIQQALFLSLGK